MSARSEPIVTSSTCILGEVVDELRARRLSGAAVSQLVAELRGRGVALQEVARYMREAFLLPGQANIALIPRLDSGEPDPLILDDYIAECVDAARTRWEHAPPYPDLMRRRDRLAFEQVARRHGIVLIVRAAQRSAAQYVGHSGFRTAPHPLLGVPRRRPPNEGLLAADPESPELRSIVGCFSADRSHAGYVAALARRGLRVGSADDSYLIRDAAGRALYPGYYLHGAFRVENGANAWTAAQGERLRAELNCRLGDDLVPTGPHDTWAQRLELDESSPLRGPLPPVLFFLPDGNVEVRTDARGMELYYRFLGINWDTLYPDANTPADDEAEDAR